MTTDALDALSSPQEYQGRRQHVFPSHKSLTRYMAAHCAGLNQAGALLLINARTYIDAAAFDRYVIAAGIASKQQRAADRSIKDEAQRLLLQVQDDPAASAAGPVTLTPAELLSRLGIEQGQQSLRLARQVSAAFRQLGWTRFRSSHGNRPWMWRRPGGQAS